VNTRMRNIRRRRAYVFRHHVGLSYYGLCHLSTKQFHQALIEKMAIAPTSEVTSTRVNGKYGTVDIRQYFIPSGAVKEIPTKKGITLRRFEWNSLKGHIADMLRLSNELANARQCSDQQSHGNLEGLLACIECNPSRDTKSLLHQQMTF